MASLFEDLWSSIFVAGTTPTLLVATNASFAALQLLLFVLLVSTYSIHFVILSLLSAALWWAINWFAAEVAKAQAGQEEEERSQKMRKDAAVTSGIESTESETETECDASVGRAAGGAMRPPPVPSRATTTTTTVSGSRLSAAQSPGQVRERHNRVESSGYLSTDSEWEKVDEKDR